MKFSFKTEKATGRWKSFQNDYHIIKLNKKQVGLIDDNTWKIRLMVIKDDIYEDNNPNCIWKWVVIKNEFGTLQEAKDWLNTNFKYLNEKYKLHQLEE